MVAAHLGQRRQVDAFREALPQAALAKHGGLQLLQHLRALLGGPAGELVLGSIQLLQAEVGMRRGGAGGRRRRRRVGQPSAPGAPAIACASKGCR